MKTTNLIIGVVGGFAVGAMLGILFAPYKGCKTRRKIFEKGSDLKDGIENLISSAENKYEEFTSKAENVKNDVK